MERICKTCEGTHFTASGKCFDCLLGKWRMRWYEFQRKAGRLLRD